LAQACLRAQDRIVAKTFFEKALTEVSTVFLALDHNHFGSGPPLLFETLVMGNILQDEMRRYASWKEAEAGHHKICAQIREKINDERM
jgi:hypothetical protein